MSLRNEKKIKSMYSAQATDTSPACAPAEDNFDVLQPTPEQEFIYLKERERDDLIIRLFKVTELLSSLRENPAELTKYLELKSKDRGY